MRGSTAMTLLCVYVGISRFECHQEYIICTLGGTNWHE